MRTDESGEVGYDGWLGDIDFWDNVVLRKDGTEIVNKRGWELGLAEIVAIRHGHHGDRFADYDPKGVGFSLHGVLKMIRHFNPGIQSEPWLDFMYKHLDLRMAALNFPTDRNNPTDKNVLSSVGFFYPKETFHGFSSFGLRASKGDTPA